MEVNTLGMKSRYSLRHWKQWNTRSSDPHEPRNNWSTVSTIDPAKLKYV